MHRKSTRGFMGILLASVLLVSMAACQQTEPIQDSSTAGTTASAATESTLPGEDLSTTTSSGESTTAASGEDGTTTKAKTTENKTTAGQTSSQTQQTTAPPTKGNVTTSLSRDQVMESMPDRLRSTTMTIFLWEDPKYSYQGGVIDSFERTTGITVKTEIANKSEYDTQLAARITAGNSPDLVKVVENNPGQVSNLQPFTNSGFDLNDTAWDIDLMKQFTFNGRIYAANLQNTLDRNLMVILYNEKALKKAGLEDPYTIWKKNPKDWTWDKLWEMCDDFVKANRNRDGYYGIMGVQDCYPRAFGMALNHYDADKGQFVNNMKNTTLVKCYEDLIDAVTKKWLSPSSDATGFTMGRTLFAAHYSSALEKTNTAFSEIRDYLGAVPVPTDSEYQPLFEFCAYGIPVGAPNKEAVPYYLRYVMDGELYNRDTFYLNDEAKEVVESMLASDKFYFGNTYRYAIWQQLLAGTASQVKSTMDAYYGDVQAGVEETNAMLKNLPQ